MAHIFIIMEISMNMAQFPYLFLYCPQFRLFDHNCGRNYTEIVETLGTIMEPCAISMAVFPQLLQLFHNFL